MCLGEVRRGRAETTRSTNSDAEVAVAQAVGRAGWPSGRAGWRTPALHIGQLACVKVLAENNSHCLGAATAAGLAVAAQGPNG